ncbi:hypothetical protein TPAR_01834, partial [Tolypocladium paradoxum]
VVVPRPSRDRRRRPRLRHPRLQHLGAALRRPHLHHRQPRRHARAAAHQQRPRDPQIRRRQQQRAQGQPPDELVPRHELRRGPAPRLSAEPAQGVRSPRGASGTRGSAGVLMPWCLSRAMRPSTRTRTPMARRGAASTSSSATSRFSSDPRPPARAIKSRRPSMKHRVVSVPSSTLNTTHPPRSKAHLLCQASPVFGLVLRLGGLLLYKQGRYWAQQRHESTH